MDRHRLKSDTHAIRCSSVIQTMQCGTVHRYWMYAAVRAGQQGILVSNDEMRDHIFQVHISLERS